MVSAAKKAKNPPQLTNTRYVVPQSITTRTAIIYIEMPFYLKFSHFCLPRKSNTDVNPILNLSST